MNTKQAKDFLVEQTAEQAALEDIPLSNIEKRMMYSTENDSTSCDNPIVLNEEFEAQHDTAVYEVKDFSPSPPRLHTTEGRRP